MTDTPEKNALALEQCKKKTKTGNKINKSKKKSVKKAILKSSASESDEDNNSKINKRKVVKKSKKKNVKKTQFPSSSEEDDYFCLICAESYEDSRPGEEWIQCTSCRNWAHDRCTSGASAVYVCINCDSE